MVQAIHYLNGQSYKPDSPKAKPADNYAGRGTKLEQDINDSNDYYRQFKKALIYKKPTPIQITKVDYPKRGKAKIVEAFYRTPSTTDYNGIYKGQYVDFEAKETKSRTSFAKKLVQPHQISHLKEVLYHKGIGFFIVRFSSFQKTYLIDAAIMLEQIADGSRKSIPYDWFELHGCLIEEGLHPRLDYLKAIDTVYHI